MSRSLWQALLISGIAGWSTTIGVHPMIGYTDSGHLAPAVAGAMIFFCWARVHPLFDVRRTPRMAADPSIVIAGSGNPQRFNAMLLEKWIEPLADKIIVRRTCSIIAPFRVSFQG
jgi:hypothetical protein